MQSLGWWIVRFDIWILNAGFDFLCRMRKDQKQRRTRWPVKNNSFKIAIENRRKCLQNENSSHLTWKASVEFVKKYLWYIIYFTISVYRNSNHTFFNIYFQGNKIFYSIYSVSFMLGFLKRLIQILVKFKINF